jgi:DNA helicase-2/ATP-dependent DNA helicase PcrA
MSKVKSPILEDLNPPQREAVIHTEGPLLILAGAGSGKTRVIAHRIAYLIQEKGVSPSNILAVTFTNKAANEMKERVTRILGNRSLQIWISTFHSFCVRVLKQDIDKLGFSPNFVIYDENDQLTLIKECVRELNLDEKYYRPPLVLSYISRAKNELLNPGHFSEQAHNFRQEKIAQIYNLYQQKLTVNQALDFDDLIMSAVELLQKYPEILNYYQDRFRYLLVDEYQDTNHAQYTLTRLLAKKYQNICVVGDEDQSIYGWRGADISNILNFEKDYPRVKGIYLEQNYRSSRSILRAASMLIRNNLSSKGKMLWTANPEGENIICYSAENPQDEARFILQEIQRLNNNTQNGGYADFVLLYRINAQSRPFEQIFIQAGIPYQVVGGIKFFERKEIKDVLAYLRVIVNPQDSLNLKRIINVPSRGVGATTIKKIEHLAFQQGISFYEALKLSLSSLNFHNDTIRKIKNFLDLMEDFRQGAVSLSPLSLTQEVIQTSGYWQELKVAEEEERLENLEEFLSAVKEYESNHPETLIGEFLAEVSLLTEIDTHYESLPGITLMTLHNAKGLEFPVVFITGMEEGLFPHIRSSLEPAELEEERRLFYVGITRAQKKLYLSNCRERDTFGRSIYNTPSRFLDEIPPELLEIKQSDHKEAFTLEKITPSYQNIFQVGEYVRHPKWGRGKIIELRGQGEFAEVTVFFENGEKKNLRLKFARLEKISFDY